MTSGEQAGDGGIMEYYSCPIDNFLLGHPTISIVVGIGSILLMTCGLATLVSFGIQALTPLFSHSHCAQENE